MDTHLPSGIEAGFRRAERSILAGRRISIHVNDSAYRVHRLSESGFAVSSDTPPLRGLVMMYDGPRLLAECLVLRGQTEGKFAYYEYKRRTEITETQPVDYPTQQDAPAALLDDKRR